MEEYLKGKCPKYSVDIRNDGMAEFVIVLEDNNVKNYTINLKKEGLWKDYSMPHPRRHFICHNDGDMVITPQNYNKLILLDWREKNQKPKVYFRARQWEFDWWMNLHFPDTANAKIYKKIKDYINY